MGLWERGMGRLGGLWGGRLELPGGCGRPLEFGLLRLCHAASEGVCLGHPARGEGGVGPRRRGEGDAAGGGAGVAGEWRLLLLVGVFGAVLLEADVPGQAADGGHGLELVDDVPGDEVDVVVAELRPDVADALSPQLVELGIIHPLDTLYIQPFTASSA